MGRGSLEDQNPITTAGSMQVSVAFSEELAKKQEHGQGVRDELYTRAGGVHYGTARLLGYRAGYERAIFRFADYNAGLYSSRNAAFQAQLAALTNLPLTFDGDLLAYGPRGDPRPEQSRTLLALVAFRARYAPEISDWQLHREVRLEKDAGFEQTAIWHAVRKAYEERFHRPPPYARLPDVAIRSPKMRSERSTAWFARSVDSHYQRCMANSAQPPPAEPQPK